MRVFVNFTNSPGTLRAGTLDSADNSSPRSAVAVSSPFYTRANGGSERAGGLPGVTQPSVCGRPGFDHEASPESGQPPAAPPRSRRWPPTRGTGEPRAAQPQPHPLRHGNYRKARRRSKTPPSQARRYWHPGLFPLVSWSDPLREGRREADSPLCGLFPCPHFAQLGAQRGSPGTVGLLPGDLLLFPTQDPLGGRVKTLPSSGPSLLPALPCRAKPGSSQYPRPEALCAPPASPAHLRPPLPARLPHTSLSAPLQSPCGSPPHLLPLS